MKCDAVFHICSVLDEKLDNFQRASTSCTLPCSCSSIVGMLGFAPLARCHSTRVALLRDS